VVWQSYTQDGSFYGVFGQRYASSGAPLGPEFRVNTYTPNGQAHPSVASDTVGTFVVVWDSQGQDGSGHGVFGQRYASSGTLLADLVATVLGVWRSYAQDGSYSGVFGQRYASTGAPLGSEFRVNTYTTNNQAVPAIASDSAGNFVVVWNSNGQDGSAYGVFGQ